VVWERLGSPIPRGVVILDSFCSCVTFSVFNSSCNLCNCHVGCYNSRLTIKCAEFIYPLIPIYLLYILHLTCSYFPFYQIRRLHTCIASNLYLDDLCNFHKYYKILHSRKCKLLIILLEDCTIGGNERKMGDKLFHVFDTNYSRPKKLTKLPERG